MINLPVIQPSQDDNSHGSSESPFRYASDIFETQIIKTDEFIKRAVKPKSL